MSLDRCIPDHYCRFCGELLTNDNWWPSCQKQNRHICTKCSRKKRRERYWNNEESREKEKAASRKWSRDHPKKNVESTLKANRKVKMLVLTHYSNSLEPVCVKCGFDDIRALSIDHVNNDGAEQRRRFGNKEYGGAAFYRWLRDNGFPLGYQTLCMNCQFIKKSR